MRGPARKALALLVAALLAAAAQAAAAAPGPAPSRIQAVVFVAGALNLAGAARLPYVDVPARGVDRVALGRAVAAGLTSGLPSATRHFLPQVAATPLFLAVLAANALPGQHPAGRGTGLLAEHLRTAGWSARAASDAAWAVGLGLLPPRPAAAWTRPVGVGTYARFAAALDHQIAARRPVAVRLVRTTRNVGTGVLDRLRLVVLGASDRPVGLLAGESVTYQVAGPAHARAAVSAGGQFLAATAGLYHVRAVLRSDLARSRIASPPVAIGVFARPVGLAIRLSSRAVVADGKDAVEAVVEAVDHRGDAVIRPCRGDFALAVGRGLRIQDPRDGAFTLQSLRLACTDGEAHFLVAAPRGATARDAAIVARAVAVRGLSAALSARAHLAIAVPRPAAVTLSLPAGPGAGVVPQGGRFGATLTVLDQAGVAVASGAYALRFDTPAGIGLVTAPGTYDAASDPTGLAVAFAVAPSAPVGPATVRVTVAGVGAAALTVRVAAASGPASGLHLAGALLSSVVPVAAVEASTVADPADSAALQVLSGGGAPSPYGGTLTVSLALAGDSAVPLGLTATLAPGATAGAYTLLLYGGSGAPAPGLYTLRIAPAPGSPPLRPLVLRLTIVAPPA